MGIILLNIIQTERSGVRHRANWCFKALRFRNYCMLMNI